MPELKIPPRRRGGPKARSMYDQYAVGDVFDVKVTVKNATATHQRLGSVLSNYVRRRNDGRKFVTRYLPEEGVIRVWRES